MLGAQTGGNKEINFKNHRRRHRYLGLMSRCTMFLVTWQ